MAQGHVQEAADRYRRARQRARKFFASDPCLTVATDVLAIELDLEQNRERPLQRRTLQSLAEVRGVWVAVYATAIAVSAELTFSRHRRDAVIPLLTRALDDVRATRIESLSHHVSALLAHYLVELGRADDAEHVWSDNNLPCDAQELLDIHGRSWRTMEALSCARVRVLAGLGKWAPAEQLANRLYRVATERGLTRTLLRCVALSIVVAHQAGQSAWAVKRMVEFIRLTREVSYVRPLVRHREINQTVLQRLLDADIKDGERRAVESMLVELKKPSPATASVFSARELEVLAGLRRGLRNKEIAAQLAITDEGVRYHLRNIYRKTGVSRRREVAHYAERRNQTAEK
jgi:LuxR family maltose regulon positive regulatory protein